MKCEICNDLISKGKEKYAGGKVVCGWCFERERTRNLSSTRLFYIKWIMKNKEKNIHRIQKGGKEK